MKNSSPAGRTPVPDGARFGRWLVALALVAWPLGAALPVRASVELDRRYALRSVGVLKSWDNVDGLFGDYVSAAFRDWFQQQSRFSYVDLSKAETVLQSSRLGYLKLIEDPEVLRQVSRSMQAESVVRTKAWKEGPRYRFKIDWLHAPRMDLLATETFNLDEPADGKSLSGEDLKKALQAAVERMVKKLPFLATVTGRDGPSITLDVGRTSGIHKGDTVIVATLDEVKKHPLLGAIVDWRTTETGRAKVEAVEEGIAFAKIETEQEGRRIGRFQKVMTIVPAPLVSEEVGVMDEARARARAFEEPPRLGWLQTTLWSGSLSRQYATTPAATAGRTGSALFLGGRGEGQLWFNREWFGDLTLGYGFSNLGQSDLATGRPVGNTSLSASAFQTRLGVGYTYFASSDLNGAKGSLRLGYQSTSYSMPASISDGAGPATWRGLYLGVSGDLPIRDHWGALLGFDFGLFTSSEATQFIAADASSSSSVNFFLGGYYRLQPRMTVRLGLDITAQGADYADGSTLTQKVTSFGPSLQYYF